MGFRKWRAVCAAVVSMKTRAFVMTALWLAGIGVAHAWDGVASGKIYAVEITGGNNYNLRVFVTGVTNMCGSGSNWAFLNESDSNYKTFPFAT